MTKHGKPVARLVPLPPEGHSILSPTIENKLWELTSQGLLSWNGSSFQLPEPAAINRSDDQLSDLWGVWPETAPVELGDNSMIGGNSTLAFGHCANGNVELRGGCVTLNLAKVVEKHPGRVFMRSHIGGIRVVDMLSGEQLPRIC